MKNTRRGRRFPVSQAVRLAVLAALIFCHALLIHGFSVFSPRVELTGEGKPALDGIPEELHAAAETEAAAASGHSPAVLAAEGDFLRYADFEMVQGAFPEREAEAAVSEETARLRFGDDSPLGRQLEAGGKAYVISGVYREKSFSRLCGVRTNAIYVRDSEAKGKTLAFFTASGTFAGQRTRDALSRAGWKVGVWQVLDLSDRLKLVRQTGALFLTFAELAAAALLAAVFACAAQRRVRSVREEMKNCYLREYIGKHDTELLLRLILWIAVGFFAAWLIRLAMGFQPYAPLSVLPPQAVPMAFPAAQSVYTVLCCRVLLAGWGLFLLEIALTIWFIVIFIHGIRKSR